MASEGLDISPCNFARVRRGGYGVLDVIGQRRRGARAGSAHRFVNTRETRALKDLAKAHSLDFILSTVNADQDWGIYMQALRPNGTLCFVGVPPAPITVHAFPMISGVRTITGSPIGPPQRIREMLDVAARHGVKAKTEPFPMGKVNEAI